MPVPLCDRSVPTRAAAAAILALVLALTPCALSAQVWGDEITCAAEPSEHKPAASATGLSVLDFFTADGAYVPRTHCLVTRTGAVDWPWITVLLVLTGSVILAYLRVFAFWMQSFFSEQPSDRNPKLFDLAAIFLWCAICGYGMSMVMFFWPGYRLLALFLVVLNAFSWRFCWNLEPFRKAFTANRLERQLREALESRAHELEKLVQIRTREAEEARLQAQAANLSKSEFLANMSHEIRTPMTAILGYADILAEEHDHSLASTEHINTIKRHGSHLLAIVNDILDLSKIEAGKMTVEHVPTDLVAIVQDVVSLMRVRARGKGLALHAEFTSAIPARVLTDPTRLRQILLNLVGNAIKFTEIGSVIIRVHWEPSQNKHSTLQVSVEDTGIGIPLQQMDRLFAEFSQADASMTRRFGGTGLGLRISKRLANMLQGDIAVESEPDRGSTFTLRMELEEAQKWSPAETPALLPLTDTEGNQLQQEARRSLLGLRVLLVEDGPDNQRLIAHLLHKAGASVLLADNGYAAIELLSAEPGLDAELVSPAPVDVVLMDIQMPKMDGYTATRLLRQKGCTLPIIALTAHSMAGDCEKCLAAGCNGYASKPIDREVLIQTIAAHMHCESC